MSINGLDVAVVALLAMFGAIGAWRGFLREFISLLAWIFAILGAWLLADVVAVRLLAYYDLAFAKIIGAVSVFMAVFILVLVAGYAVRRVFFPRKARIPGRIAGGLLGATRGGVVVLILVLLAGLFLPLPQKPVWKSSIAMRYFQALALEVKSFFPPEVAQQFRYG